VRTFAVARKDVGRLISTWKTNDTSNKTGDEGVTEFEQPQSSPQWTAICWHKKALFTYRNIFVSRARKIDKSERPANY
jgi:hypothetical protein